MPFLGVQPADTFAAVAKQTITGDGSTTYTLTHSVASANDLAVYINNVRQEPTTAYSASGTSITFTEAIASTDSCYVVYIARTFQTLSPPDNSVNADQISYPLTNFSSTGIDDNADATAISIDSSEIVTVSPSGGVITLGQHGQITSKQSLDVATAGGRYIGSSNRGIVGQIRIEQTATGADGGYVEIDTCATGSTSPTKRLRVDTDGLKFGSDTAAANALDDYEEGTWTPTSVSNISAIANANGHYTKIGNVVTINFFADITPAHSTSYIALGGLPYTVDDAISGSQVEATGVVFEDSKLYMFFALGSNTQIWIEGDRPIHGSQDTLNRSYRGSLSYFAA